MRYLNQNWALLFKRGLARLADGVVHSEGVGSVHTDSRDPVGWPSACNPITFRFVGRQQ